MGKECFGSFSRTKTTIAPLTRPDSTRFHTSTLKTLSLCVSVCVSGVCATMLFVFVWEKGEKSRGSEQIKTREGRNGGKRRSLEGRESIWL